MARSGFPRRDRASAAGTAGTAAQRRVFFVHLLGFVTPTEVRRITLEQSIAFERHHEQAYRSHGFELVDIPGLGLDERVDLIDGYLRSWADED